MAKYCYDNVGKGSCTYNGYEIKSVMWFDTDEMKFAVPVQISGAMHGAAYDPNEDMFLEAVCMVPTSSLFRFISEDGKTIITM